MYSPAAPVRVNPRQFLLTLLPLSLVRLPVSSCLLLMASSQSTRLPRSSHLCSLKALKISCSYCGLLQSITGVLNNVLGVVNGTGVGSIIRRILTDAECVFPPIDVDLEASGVRKMSSNLRCVNKRLVAVYQSAT